VEGHRIEFQASCNFLLLEFLSMLQFLVLIIELVVVVAVQVAGAVEVGVVAAVSFFFG
jgi:hypothetical protein